MADRIKKTKDREKSFDTQKTKEMPFAPYSEEELIALKAYSPLSDVEKNIDEAERYIDAIVNGKIASHQKSENQNFSDSEESLKSTEEISLFEPKNIHFEEKEFNNRTYIADYVGITNNKPKCPTCGSTNIKKISTTSKVLGAAMWGLFSKTAHSQFQCNNCGYKW